jgi:hypothetical protein
VKAWRHHAKTAAKLQGKTLGHRRSSGTAPQANASWALCVLLPYLSGNPAARFAQLVAVHHLHESGIWSSPPFAVKQAMRSVAGKPGTLAVPFKVRGDSPTLTKSRKEDDLMFRKCIALALAAVFIAPAFSFAESKTLTWRIQSFDKQVVNVQFYSANRKHVWPSPDKVYSIEDYEVHSYPISCIAGEKVCYGAWVRGKSSSHWGRGKDGKHGCNDCCYVCTGGTTPIRKLND